MPFTQLTTVHCDQCNGTIFTDDWGYQYTGNVPPQLFATEREAHKTAIAAGWYCDARTTLCPECRAPSTPPLRVEAGTLTEHAEFIEDALTRGPVEVYRDGKRIATLLSGSVGQEVKLDEYGKRYLTAKVGEEE